MEFPYGDEFIDVKVEEIYDAYLEVLDDYIRDEILVPGRDMLPLMVKVKKRIQDASGNPVRKENSNTILDTRIYDLDFPYGNIEVSAVKLFT